MWEHAFKEGRIPRGNLYPQDGEARQASRMRRGGCYFSILLFPNLGWGQEVRTGEILGDIHTHVHIYPRSKASQIWGWGEIGWEGRLGPMAPQFMVRAAREQVCPLIHLMI